MEALYEELAKANLLEKQIAANRAAIEAAIKAAQVAPSVPAVPTVVPAAAAVVPGAPIDSPSTPTPTVIDVTDEDDSSEPQPEPQAEQTEPQATSVESQTETQPVAQLATLPANMTAVTPMGDVTQPPTFYHFGELMKILTERIPNPALIPNAFNAADGSYLAIVSGDEPEKGIRGYVRQLYTQQTMSDGKGRLARVMVFGDIHWN